MNSENEFWAIMPTKDDFCLWRLTPNNFVSEEDFKKIFEFYKDVGLVFITKEEAEAYLKLLKVQKKSLKHTIGSKPHWISDEEWKTYIYFDPQTLEYKSRPIIVPKEGGDMLVKE